MQPLPRDTIIAPYACDLAVAEGDRGIAKSELRVVEVLDPDKLVDNYQALFPFTFQLLIGFKSSPNKYSRQSQHRWDKQTKADIEVDKDESDEVDSEAGDSLELGDDGTASLDDWCNDPPWKGFTRCPFM